jgi:hypothetical protein
MMLILDFKMFIDWVANHLLSCPLKQTFGLDCPGCGFQRSILLLIKGDFNSSLKMYPATVPILTLLLFLPTHLKFDFKNGARLIKGLYIGIALIILFNYILKIYTHKLY